MSVSFNTYQTMVKHLSNQTSGLSVYTRNLSQYMLTAKLFPVIQKTTSKETLQLFSAAQSAFKIVQQTSEALRKQNNPYVAHSSNSEALTLLQNSPVKEPIKIHVKQVATPQRNQSKRYYAEDNQLAAKASLAITLKTKSKETQITVDISESRTNRDTLSAISEALNTTSLVSASLQEADGRVSLSIEGSETGTDNTFVFSGDDAEELGLNTQVQQGQNSRIELNGSLIEQQTRAFDLELENLRFEVHQPTNSEITISNRPSTAFTLDYVDQLTQAVNVLTDSFKSQGHNPLWGRLTQGYALQKDTLESIGITLEDHVFSVNQAQLKEALEQNPLLTKTLSQFGNINANVVKNLNPATLLKEDLQKTYYNSELAPFYLTTIGTIIDNNPQSGHLLDMLV